MVFNFICIVLTIIIGIFTKDILTVMRTPADIFDDAYIYIFIIFMGIPATILYNMVSGVLRSLGDSFTPVVFLIFSSILNIILDLILVKRMGVSGAAVADSHGTGSFRHNLSYLHREKIQIS